jgi:hypothetical protein
VPWLALSLNPFFDVASETVIDGGCRTSGSQVGNNIRDHPAHRSGRPDYGHGPMILFHNHLEALLNFGKDGVEIERQFGFGDADRAHA